MGHAWKWMGQFSHALTPRGSKGILGICRPTGSLQHKAERGCVITDFPSLFFSTNQ